MRDADTTYRAVHTMAGLVVLGFFGRLFGGGGSKSEVPQPAQLRVVVETKPTPPPPEPKIAPIEDPLRRQLLYQGLHDNVNPAENVRTGQVTCASCDHQFRVFLNSTGRTTTVRCPKCSRTIRM